MRLVIDTDTASDDAVALMLALAEPGVTVDAITVVAGNVPLPLAVRNAIVTCDVMGRSDVPVHAGRHKPILRRLDTAQDVHGADGMGGATLPEPSRDVDAEHAVAALLRLASDGVRRTLVTLGPLSNLATALLLDPDFLGRWDHVWCMYGVADSVGNSSPSAEFNVWADPESARVVLEHAHDPERLTFVGWDVSRKYAVITPAEQDELIALGTARGDFVQQINVAVDRFCREITGLPGYDLPDPVTMAVALRPELITASEIAAVDVISNGPGRGTLMIERRPGVHTPTNVRLVTGVDERGFKTMLRQMCAGH
jgi:purine nucleosidase